jgi:glucose 1-dehydrogenase
MRLQGRRAVVTGSGRGIGRAIAIRFTREGADVVISDLGVGGTAWETLAAVKAAGRRGVLVRADVSRIDDARRLIDDGVRLLGPLDILVKNAGIEKQAPFVVPLPSPPSWTIYCMTECNYIQLDPKAPMISRGAFSPST